MSPNDNSFFTEILSTESPEALTGSASGLKRLRRWATAYIIFHQIVEPWIELGTSGYKVSDFTTTRQLL